VNAVEAGSGSALKKVMAMADSHQRGNDENRRGEEELRENKLARDADKRQHEEAIKSAEEAAGKRVAEAMAKHETDVEAMNSDTEEHRLRSERAVTEMRELLDSRSTRPYLSFADLQNDPVVRGKAATLTGFASADVAVAFWDLLNHDGAAWRMKMWKSAAYSGPEPENRKRAATGRPMPHKFKWEDVYFMFWFHVNCGVTQEVAATFFNIEESATSRALVSVTSFQEGFLLIEFEQPTPEMIRVVMPPGFERVYGTKFVQEIFDTCEGPIEVLSSSEAQKQNAATTSSATRERFWHP